MGQRRQSTLPRSTYDGHTRQALNCDLTGLRKRGHITAEERRELQHELESNDPTRQKRALLHIDNLIAKHPAPRRTRRRKSGRGGRAVRGGYDGYSRSREGRRDWW